MTKVKVLIPTMDDVKAFVNIINHYQYDFDLVSGKYVIDAKSIMGIFSLDISVPIDLIIHTEDDTSALLKDIDQYLVK